MQSVNKGIVSIYTGVTLLIQYFYPHVNVHHQGAAADTECTDTAECSKLWISVPKLIHSKLFSWLTLASYPVWEVPVTHALIVRRFVLRQLPQPFLNLLLRRYLPLFSYLQYYLFIKSAMYVVIILMCLLGVLLVLLIFCLLGFLLVLLIFSLQSDIAFFFIFSIGKQSIICYFFF